MLGYIYSYSFENILSYRNISCFFDDSIFFIAGSLDTTSGVKSITLTVSGVDDVYRVITEGVNLPQLKGDDIYKKVYGRLLPGGSLF